jgi:ubiquitin C-terminal hydrolase
MKEFIQQAKTGICDNKSFVDYFKEDFPPGKQHDMPEFFRKLIDSLDKELHRPRQVEECDPWREYQASHSKLVVSVFSGMASSRISCFGCHDKRESFEPFTLLTLQVTTNLNKSVEKYLEKEIIQGQYLCQACGKTRDLEKQYSFVILPNILVIQLKRFVTVPFHRKINMHCEFPFELELNTSERVKYDLKSIAVHSGNATCGHYSAFCKRGNKWFMFDDSNFQEVDPESVRQVQGYLLMYVKKAF